MRRNVKIVTLVVITVATLSSVCWVYAASTMQQATWFYGNGVPIDHKADGSFYMDLETNSVYQCRKLQGDSFEWVLIASGIGSEGVDGKDGKDGMNGATWLFGATDPTSSQGANGDLYLNCATWNVFAKGDGSWTVLGNIKGQDGVNGLNGLNGLNGKDGGNGTNGVNGLDFNSTGNLSLYNGTNGVNGRDGVDGIDGQDGRDGTNGLNGVNGANGLNGNDGINGTNGLDGKAGLDFNATGAVFLYNGTDGLDGVNGTSGKDGKDGMNGMDGLNGSDGKDGVNGVNGADGKSWTEYVSSIPNSNGYGYEIPWWFYAILSVGFIASLFIICYAFVTGSKQQV